MHPIYSRHLLCNFGLRNNATRAKFQSSRLLSLKLAVELALAHEEGAEQCKKHYNNQEAKALVGRPAVAIAHDLSDIRVQLLDIIETFSDPVDYLVDVLAVVQLGPEPLAQELLYNACRQRESDHRTQGTEEIRACGNHSLIFHRRIGDCPND